MTTDIAKWSKNPSLPNTILHKQHCVCPSPTTSYTYWKKLYFIFTRL